MEALTNTVQHYDWGEIDAFANLGVRADGLPHAELWMGSHPSSPSLLADGRRLDDVISADPIGTLGADNVDRFGPNLPFLFKVLAARRPLSIQAHPSKAQAEAGFARENAAGTSLDAPGRNYRDANHKPELICALDNFEALYGFRPYPEAAHDLEVAGLDRWARHLRQAGAQHCLEAMLRSDPDVVAHDAATAAAGNALAARLQTLHPGDVGVLVALLLNHVVLKPGQALFLGAGNLHAYLHGLGVELMANSDNVLRGGLTSKHVDVEELLAVVDTTPGNSSTITNAVDGLYPAPVDEFALLHLGAAGERRLIDVHGPAILLCTSGEVEVDEVVHPVGSSFFVRADENVAIRARGTSWLARVASDA